MANVVSKVRISVAYGVGKLKVVIRPGNNAIADADVEKLKNGDPNFTEHVKRGHLVVAADEAPKVKEKVAIDPRARLPKESDKAYKSRMTKLDDEAAQAADAAGRLAADQKLWDDFAGLDDADKPATLETLDDREKALVQGERPE